VQLPRDLGPRRLSEMRREEADASAILRRVPSGRQQPDGALLTAAAAPAAGAAGAAGDQQQRGWDNDHEDDTRSEMGNENFKARVSLSRVRHPRPRRWQRGPSFG